MKVELKVEETNKGFKVLFLIGNQQFQLKEIEDPFQQDALTEALFLRAMLEKAFKNLGAKPIVKDVEYLS